MTRTLVLIDGEHYPPVVERALDNLRSRGHDVVAALFLGGSEKAAVPPDLGVPLVSGDPDVLLGELIDEHRPSVVVDMSDEPILDYRGRLRLVGLSLRHGVAYEGGGFRFEPPRRPRLTHRPSVAVIGTGKRTGKTAVTIELARHWKRQGHSVCIVTMGRGGPAEPVVLEAGSFEAGPAGLRRLARKGVHAASDYVEDAVFAGVDTVGTWRCGAGPTVPYRPRPPPGLAWCCRPRPLSGHRAHPLGGCAARDRTSALPRPFRNDPGNEGSQRSLRRGCPG